MSEHNQIALHTQYIVDRALGLEYEYVFDVRKAWQILSGTIFLLIPFRLILTVPLSFWSSIGIVACIFVFMRVIIGDPFRRQLTLESLTRLTTYLYEEMNDGDSPSVSS